MRAARSNPSPVPPSKPTSTRRARGAPSRRTVIAKHRYARDTYSVTGAKQSSAGGITYGTYRRILRQPWIASPRFNGTYRKCGGGFAKTGRAKPCPVPAPCAGTVDGGCAAHSAVRERAGLKPAPTLPPSKPRNYSLSIINYQLT
ncbi:MAG: hypothetical protein LBM98_03255 [Oscillospiraceae bacterium]|nr:hypothetical protein [Oscillospiraceae bacterium]